MNKVKCLLVTLAFLSGSAHAMDGTFDRSTEVKYYIQKINSTSSQPEMIEIAKPIYISGISDEQLAEAIGERLLKDLPSIDDSRVSSQYGAWMVKALGSTGTEYARNVITEVSKKTKVHRVLLACEDKLREIEWERHKNEVMASRKNYNEGDDMKVAQLLNLLQDPDFTYKENATYRMSWDKILNERLMQEIAKQLQAFVDRNGITNDKAEIAAMGNFAKMLGYSENRSYRPLLLALYKSGATGAIKSQARSAVSRLDARK